MTETQIPVNTLQYDSQPEALEAVDYGVLHVLTPSQALLLPAMLSQGSTVFTVKINFSTPLCLMCSPCICTQVSPLLESSAALCSHAA